MPAPYPAGMQITDTRTRARIDLTTGRTVRVYVCGITPYDSTHLGHAFTYVATDALIGYLEHIGHRVIYTRNITDVDDDILRKAAEQDVDYLELGGLAQDVVVDVGDVARVDHA